MQSGCHPGENGRIIRGLLYKETIFEGVGKGAIYPTPNQLEGTWGGSEGWGPKEMNLVGVALRGDVSFN